MKKSKKEFFLNEIPKNTSGECIVILHNYTSNVYEYWLVKIKNGTIKKYIELVKTEQA